MTAQRWLHGALAATLVLTTACMADEPDEAAREVEALAGGNTPGHLQEHGWSCAVIIGLVHCFNPTGLQFGKPVIPVWVYDGQDITSFDADFLGTEHIIRADLYAGQPCAPEDGDPYDPLDLTGDGVTDYYACHHLH